MPKIASSDDSTIAARRKRSLSVFLRSVMSRAIVEAPITLPLLSLIGEIVSET